MLETRIEPLLVCGYAVFLTVVAMLFEFLARRSHRRTQALPTTGFTYQGNLDVWICPTGQPLRRIHSSPGGKIVRYRAEARMCNECPVKNRCTNSETGRLIEHYPDSWLQSGLRVYHHGLSLMLFVLAFSLIMVELFRQNGFAEQTATGVLAIIVGGRVLWSLMELHSTGKER